MKNRYILMPIFMLMLAALFLSGNVPAFQLRGMLPWVKESPRPGLVAGKHKIPLDPDRWYQLNNTSQGLHQLFDGQTDKKVETGHNKLLHSFEAYYPVLPGEELGIETVLFYDGEGSSEQLPFTLSVIDEKWQRRKIATFTGDKYETWVGPTSTDDNFQLPIPVRNVRYLVISTASFYPTEMELYGTYKAGPKLAVPPAEILARQKKVKFKQTAGVNAFEWDFADPQAPHVIQQARWQAIKAFTGIRHYLDWEKLELKPGQYSFDPALAGGWNYDAIYERCRSAGIDVLTCLKTLPPWMLETYPSQEQDAENVPVKFGKDFSDPASYIEQARAGFQFAARYGQNKNLDPALLQVSQTERWPGAPRNQVRIGLNLVRYIECDNERDKWWKGRKAYQTGREYAANLSAFYDGHKNTLGPGVGVKNADPAMQVVMAGLAHPTTDYIQGMIDWCREFRGYKPDGQVNLCWDVINYHLYANNAQSSQHGQSSRGAAPEVSQAARVARDFVLFAHQYAGGMPVWITETGYDLSQQSPLKAIPIKGKSAAQTQADWILRSALLYARCGVEKVFFYQLSDDNADNPGQFGTSGLINADRSRRPAADYLSQVNQLLGEYAYQETLSIDPLVDRYAYQGQSVYVLVVPDEKGRQVQTTLNLGDAPAAYIYHPQVGQDSMRRESVKTRNGQLRLTVTETPILVKAVEASRQQK